MSVLVKIRFNKKETESSQTKKGSFPIILKARIFNTNPNNIELRMMQEGLKCKQLEEEIQPI